MRKERTVKKLIFVTLVLTLITALCAPVSFGAQKELRVVLANHPWTDAIKPLIPEFEKANGIKVKLESYEENQLTSKLTVEFTSNASSIDLFMARPLQEGRLFAKNNWYQPIDKYVKKTKADWNVKDFSPVTMQAVTYNKKLCGIPLIIEWQVLFYRKDLFERAKVKVPTNLVELENAAKALNNPKEDIYGIVIRGQRAAAVSQLSSFIYTFGGEFLKGGKCVIDSPQAIKAIKYYGKLLGSYGPSGVANMGWPQAQALFAAGKAAMWIDSGVLGGMLFDPAKSKVSDKVAIAPCPAKNAYMVTSWSLAMANQSKNKDNAWKFMKWVTSPAITKKVQMLGNTMARDSVWDDKEVLTKIRPDLADSMRKLSPHARPSSLPLMTAVSEARDVIGEILVKSIMSNGADPGLDAAAKNAARKVNELLKKSGEFRKGKK
jgi:multiple sugar transport system substrate-binding protein